MSNGNKPLIGPTRKSVAIHVLCKMFVVSYEVFAILPVEILEGWVRRVMQPGYTLNAQEYDFLIGRGWKE